MHFLHNFRSSHTNIIWTKFKQILNIRAIVQQNVKLLQVTVTIMQKNQESTKFQPMTKYLQRQQYLGV